MALDERMRPTHDGAAMNHKYLCAPPAALAAAVLGFTALTTPPAHACDACNLSFADQLLTGERSDSLIARELRKAMENQKGLPIDGISDPQLIELQEAKLESAPPKAAARSSTQTISTAGTRAAAASQIARAAQGAPLAVQASLAETVGNLGASRVMPDYLKDADFIEILERDYALETRPYSTVPQDAPVDKSFTVTLHEGQTYIGNGVVYDGFLIDGGVPGPTLVADEGDVIEFNVANKGTIPHGASIHAAYTQTSKYVGKVMPGTTKSVRFRAMTPGVYMYHCAPGGHAIPMHVIGGQYGMMVIRPKNGGYKLEEELGHPPDLELSIIQHELYASGQKAMTHEAEYAMFNGRLFGYVEEPIVTNPGDYVRINFINTGPNNVTTFHIVGILWDYIYWQGHPEARLPGGQTVTAGPSDSFVIEFRMPPDEGAYTMLTHAVGSAARGAIGLIVVDSEAELEPHRHIDAQGPSYTDEEKSEFVEGASRVIAPFGIGTHPVDRPVVFGPHIEHVDVSIIGNSFHPKVIEVYPGTEVTWTNEDVFAYMGGEFAGIHNAVAISMPEGADAFATPLLAHAESSSIVVETPGEYEYICAPHPYMKAKVIVRDPKDD